jgi:hypothetical protein
LRLVTPTRAEGPDDLRRLLAEAIGLARQLVDSSHEADHAEDNEETTHWTAYGDALVTGEDVPVLLGALGDEANWSEHVGQRRRSARYRDLASRPDTQ